MLPRMGCADPPLALLPFVSKMGVRKQSRNDDLDRRGTILRRIRSRPVEIQFKRIPALVLYGWRMSSGVSLTEPGRLGALRLDSDPQVRLKLERITRHSLGPAQDLLNVLQTSDDIQSTF